jgi:hypothetical protein
VTGARPTDLLEEGRLTRAELATRTGISKSTISGSVRRLVDADPGNSPRSTAIETARVRQEPSLTGARTEALEQLRSTITTSARTLAKATTEPMNTLAQGQE